jgi:hypothetical protein
MTKRKIFLGLTGLYALLSMMPPPDFSVFCFILLAGVNGLVATHTSLDA